MALTYTVAEEQHLAAAVQKQEAGAAVVRTNSAVRFRMRIRIRASHSGSRKAQGRPKEEVEEEVLVVVLLEIEKAECDSVARHVL
jgi:hypothetical protein